MGTGFYGGFGRTNKSNVNESDILIKELEKNDVKFTKENIVFITKDQTGQIVWLETGNKSAGLSHILDGDGITSGHAADFERAFGVPRNQIPSFLNSIVSKGTVVSNELRIINGREGFERVYYYNNKYYVLAGIGTNGFIVTAYPVEYGG